MNHLLNNRFYYLISNTIKRNEFNWNIFMCKSMVNKCQNKRFINNRKNSDKNVIKSKTSNSFEKEIINNFEKQNKNIKEMKNESNDLIKTLDSNEMAFRITVTEMQRFLEKNHLNVSNGRTCLSIKCPFCESRSERSECLDKTMNSRLYINKRTSNFLCYSCETSGLWISFVEMISALNNRKSDKSGFELPKVNSDLFGDQNTRRVLNQILENSLSLDELSEDHLKSVYNKFGLNGLKKSSLQFFDVCVSKDLKQLIFPFKSCYNKNTINAIKTIELIDENERTDSKKFVEKLFPIDSKLSVFGLNQHFLNNCSFDELVITDSPFDAIAVTQQTNIPSISMPFNGVLAQLRPELLPFFERFKKITIWFSNSVQDLNCAKNFARKLDENRCYFVGQRDQLNQLKTPFNALKQRLKLSHCLESSQRISHSAITTFQSLRHAILCEIKDPLCSGVQWKRFPELNQHLKGHRSGELTVFTGPTGSGKTTFMSEYSLDLCSQGVRTLWGSFEVKNVRLAKMMLTQFAGKSMIKHMDEFDLWADKFEELPLYFMTFHGQESIANVLSAMSHSVYVYDIKHVIIDNIQFMLGCAQNSGFDRFWQQDLVLDQFRKFATREDCHVSLVMHPRKEEDMDELNNNSIFGGAKATQEADNVLIIQNKWLSAYKCHKYVQITKNRWDGDLGKVPLWFDKESLSFSPLNRRLVRFEETKEITVADSHSPIDSNQSNQSNKGFQFATIKCKSEEDFDDFRLQ